MKVLIPNSTTLVIASVTNFIARPSVFLRNQLAAALILSHQLLAGGGSAAAACSAASAPSLPGPSALVFSCSFLPSLSICFWLPDLLASRLVLSPSSPVWFCATGAFFAAASARISAARFLRLVCAVCSALVCAAL